MFGYVTLNNKISNKEDKDIYQSYYCGLCHALKKNAGQLSRLTLNYDLTFLALFLNGVYDSNPEKKAAVCPVHPFKKYNYFENDIISYCADMNIMLVFYKMKDDWNDDKNIGAYISSKVFEKKLSEIKKKYPRQSEMTEKCLKKLSETEKKNILVPDIPASIFGDLMSELFVYKDDEKSELLRNFGFALGKFIYIIDACCDLKKDIKKKSYNPLIMTDRKNFRDILTLLLSDCTGIYQKLNINKNKSIIDNILYSGIWTKYELNKKRKEKNDKRSL